MNMNDEDFPKGQTEWRNVSTASNEAWNKV